MAPVGATLGVGLAVREEGAVRGAALAVQREERLQRLAAHVGARERVVARDDQLAGELLDRVGRARDWDSK